MCFTSDSHSDLFIKNSIETEKMLFMVSKQTFHKRTISPFKLLHLLTLRPQRFPWIDVHATITWSTVMTRLLAQSENVHRVVEAENTHVAVITVIQGVRRRVKLLSVQDSTNTF